MRRRAADIATLLGCLGDAPIRVCLGKAFCTLVFAFATLAFALAWLGLTLALAIPRPYEHVREDSSGQSASTAALTWSICHGSGQMQIGRS